MMFNPLEPNANWRKTINRGREVHALIEAWWSVLHLFNHSGVFPLHLGSLLEPFRIIYRQSPTTLDFQSLFFILSSIITCHRSITLDIQNKPRDSSFIWNIETLWSHVMNSPQEAEAAEAFVVWFVSDRRPLMVILSLMWMPNLRVQPPLLVGAHHTPHIIQVVCILVYIY